MMNGEDLGGMLESDYEDLAVDLEFENQRHLMEVGTDSPSQVTPPSSIQQSDPKNETIISNEKQSIKEESHKEILKQYPEEYPEQESGP